MIDEGQGVPCRFRFGEAEFDESCLMLRVGGQVVSVEPLPLRVLAELLRHAREVVTREELFEAVWDGRPTVDNVLANAITKLRKALGAQGARIVNVPRIGYRFVGEVECTPVGSVRAEPPRTGFQAGMPVPGREGFLLLRPLGVGERNNVWLAREEKLGRERVFKFATTAAELQALKRESTLLRVLHSELGERSDIARVVDVAFSHPPYYMECEYGGVDLLAWAEGPDAPLQGLSLRQRLALFTGIADAVAAAHGLGVLHKDLPD